MRKIKHNPNQISIIDTLQLPLGHGGKRDGAGRKKSEPTTTIRVPVSLIPTINKLVMEHKGKA
ncbi:hypothetical protein CIK00_03275 [Photobacterium carnosum]|uniref:Uncharacterized protein n=1 Tax=Photobacterium carnosum TaxID=2023717 RepID=A0A2N4UW91_9GAMM|nr:hypothetical protein CIK00_03275 [Photobacterium carnosum]